MSSEQDRVKELAERVARRLDDAPREQGEGSIQGGGELAAVRASLAEIQRRLTHIESHITHGEDCGRGAREPNDARPPSTSSANSPTRSPSPQAGSTWLSGTYVPATAHPSQEQFEGLGEAVSELVEFFEREKTCTLEPGGKPCDHCGQCSARGF
ncbi:MAG: hypothetical protein JOZ02_17335 [Acidobacteria bacterium]|nr:hypothetical protein [Acidobacteriota bacterium]